ncbi:hypothetical protein [Ciceribacter sp. L1K22]|uniref:hypothetical protein n=1 Tax=Ciceribacter sp. L1K22 TaxID=2820275 RepID=UPI001ABEB25A|nr:hypothetical protein [Ciceribacter sp. L1K22]MBO3759306.1 hypothetical protein [Ciceribacter sp. L1K22]
MTLISVSSMIRGEFHSPLAPRSRLEDLGKFLGVPERWDFGIEDEFICQLGYKDFEISLRARNNKVEIERIWIELWDSLNDVLIPKKRIRLTRHLKVDFGVFLPGLPISKAKMELEKLDIRYQEIDILHDSEFRKVLKTSKKSELYFYSDDNEQSLMEIHFL